ALLRLRSFPTRRSSDLFTFDARSAVDSVMIVPEFVLDRRRDGTWLRYIYCTETVAPSADEIFTAFVEQLPDEPAVAAETELMTRSEEHTSELQSRFDLV